MEITKTSPKDFINSLPEEAQDGMRQLDKLITNAMSAGSEKVMWEGKFWGGSDQKIIGYGHTVFVGSSKKEVHWFRIGLALQKNYIAIHVVAFDAGKYLAERYKGQFGKAKVGKSTITFNKVEDIKLDILEEVIKQAFASESGK